jgi:putative DNA primase/helicase
MSNLEAALDAISEGMFVFPCNQKRRPLAEHGLLDAVNNSEQVHKWWTRMPQALVAVNCGMSGYVVLDLDDQSAIDLIRQEHPAWLETRRVRTQSGMMHLWYAAPTGHRVKSTVKAIAEIPNTDTRATGGYAIIAGLGEEGEYRTLDARKPAPMPQDLLEILIRNKIAIPDTPAPAPEARPAPRQERLCENDIDAAVTYYLNRYTGMAGKGNRNDVGLKLACQLRDLGLSEGQAERVMLTYQRSVTRASDEYTEQEARATLKSAYNTSTRAAATPWKAVMNARQQKYREHVKRILEGQQ